MIATKSSAKKKPVKKSATKQKTISKKKPAPAKKSTPVKKLASIKKPKLVCGVCGYSVTVDHICGCAEEHALICCGKAMAKK
jgi:hypothetical protein